MLVEYQVVSFRSFWLNRFFFLRALKLIPYVNMLVLGQPLDTSLIPFFIVTLDVSAESIFLANLIS